MAKKAKLTIEHIVNELNAGRSVFDIAAAAGRHEYDVRYLLKANGYRRIVRWEKVDKEKSE